MVATDLSVYLPPPPGTDWVEASVTPTVIDGPFTARDYGVLVSDTASERALNKYGFVAGFGRTWEQRGTHDYLVERVFQFDSTRNAIYWYDGLKLDNQTSKYFKREIPGLSAGPSFGVELAYDNGDHEFRVEFAKGPLMFVVHLITAGDDQSQTALGLAQAEYDLAPTAPGAANNPPLSESAMSAMGIALVALVVMVGAVVFALVRSSRRNAAPTAFSAGVQTSPDGYYWWDGARWRVVATDPPPKPPY
jgi:hypothetical protein